MDFNYCVIAECKKGTAQRVCARTVCVYIQTKITT